MLSLHFVIMSLPLQFSCRPPLEGLCKVSLEASPSLGSPNSLTLLPIIEMCCSPQVIPIASLGLAPTGPYPSCAGAPRAESSTWGGASLEWSRGGQLPPLPFLVKCILLLPKHCASCLLALTTFSLESQISESSCRETACAFLSGSWCCHQVWHWCWLLSVMLHDFSQWLSIQQWDEWKLNGEAYVMPPCAHNQTKREAVPISRTSGTVWQNIAANLCPEHSKMHEEQQQTVKSTHPPHIISKIFSWSDLRKVLVCEGSCSLKCGMEIVLFLDPCLLRCPKLHTGSFSTFLLMSLFIFVV